MGAGRREQGGENWAGVIAESGALYRGRAGEQKCPHSLAPSGNTLSETYP